MVAPQGPRRGPIFIVGAMGSGTTLLRLVLDSHPNIGIPRETGFMRAYNAHRFAPFKHSGRDWIERLGWEPDEVTDELRRFYDGLFMRYAAKHGKQRWGEKTPSHTWHVDGMRELFPDAQFIGVVRHPMGCAASNMSRFGMRLAKARTHVTRYQREIARQAVNHADRFVLVHYEDLVLRPEATMRELLDWLGEPWSDDVLQHHEVQSGREGPRKVEGRSRTDDPIDVSRIDKWTRTMEPRHQRFLSRHYEPYARFYGYRVDDGGPPERIGAPDRVLITGEDIAARMQAFPDIDIAEPMPLMPAEMLYDPRKLTVVRKQTARKKPAKGARPGATARLRGAVSRRLRRS